MKRTGPTSIVTRKLIRELRNVANEQGSVLWDYVAELLERPSRRRVVVNISKIERYSAPGECVVIPGKVLGAGTLTKPVTIAALAFSKKALEKIREVGGTAVSIEYILEINPRGSNVRVIM